MYLGFNDGDKTIRLADGSIASQNIGILQDSLVGRSVLADLQDAAPFGELTTIFLVLGASFVQIVQTFSGKFI
jgi:hypothetical protein